MNTRVIYKGKRMEFTEQEVKVINKFGAFAFNKGMKVGCFVGGFGVLIGTLIVKFFI